MKNGFEYDRKCQKKTPLLVSTRGHIKIKLGAHRFQCLTVSLDHDPFMTILFSAAGFKSICPCTQILPFCHISESIVEYKTVCERNEPGVAIQGAEIEHNGKRLWFCWVPGDWMTLGERQVQKHSDAFLKDSSITFFFIVPA